MNFFKSVGSCFSNSFTGRAPRSEYWHWKLFLFLVLGMAMAIGYVLITAIFSSDASGTLLFMIVLIPVVPAIAAILFLIPFLALIWMLIPPTLAVAVRRLHDTGKSGWWVLLIPTVIGIIPYAYLICQEGDFDNNRFGPDPLAGDPSHIPTSRASVEGMIRAMPPAIFLGALLGCLAVFVPILTFLVEIPLEIIKEKIEYPDSYSK